MKSILFILCLLAYFGTWSQSDTTCIKSRWIVIKKSDENKVLFDPNQHILKAIKDQTHEFKLLPYHSEYSGFEYPPFRPSPLVKHDSSFIDYSDFLDTSYHLITIYAQSDVPLVDEYGEPLTIEQDDGSTTFLYEEPTRYTIDIDEICEIRIREDRSEKSTQDQGAAIFEVTRIGFYSIVDFEIKEIFWVNFKTLSNNLTEYDDYPWYEFIQKREYSGFQYKQTSCYDLLIRH